MSTFLHQWKRRARELKVETYALYLAYRDPRVPWYAKVFVACLVAYAFSPIDLIPDPIPILGYLDDLILIPLGVALALKMIPAPLMAEFRIAAGERFASGKPINRGAAIIIVGLWILFAMLVVALLIRVLR